MGAYNVYNSGHITATSVTAAGLPGTGATVYAEVWSYMNGAWGYTPYTLTEGQAALPVLSAISFLRVAPFARARFATFAQAMSNTIRTAPNAR